jgi:hypothetical protein
VTGGNSTKYFVTPKGTTYLEPVLEVKSSTFVAPVEELLTVVTTLLIFN